jgi:hypothetical protein
VTDALSLFRYFVEATREHPPKVIIAGMDQFYFKPENAKNNIVYRPNSLLHRTHDYDAFFSSLFLQGGWWKVYRDYVESKFTLADVFTSKNDAVARIGLRARATGSGFLNDGSNYFGDVIGNVKAQREGQESIKNLADSISETNGDEYGTTISPEALAEVRHFLSEARKNESVVVGFIPPVSPSVYARLRAYPNAPYADSVRTLGSRLKAVYAEYGYDFYDFSDFTKYGGRDEEMAESKHGGEMAYLRMFIYMAEHSSALRPYADIPYLEEKLRSANSSVSVFPITL